MKHWNVFSIVSNTFRFINLKLQKKNKYKSIKCPELDYKIVPC